MARAQAIGHQVHQILKAHNGIHQSKKESREQSGIKSLESGHKVSDKFHSYKSLDNARSHLTDLGKFAKSEYGIKDMSKIDINIVKNWIESKNLSYRSASNYLSELNKLHKHFNFTREEIKEIRSEFRNTLEKPDLSTRAYKNLDKVQLQNEKAQIAFQIQRDYGLRQAAATHIKVNEQIVGNTLFYKEKGGKLSQKELNPTLISKIKENAVNGVFHIPQRTYYDQVKKAIEEQTKQKFNGTHGIRHTYAQKQLEAGKSKLEVSKELGHVREEITNVYLR